MLVPNSQKIKFLQRYFKKGDLNRTEDQLAFWCPVCNSSDKQKKKLVVRLSDGWYHCWVCGTSGKSYNSLFRKLCSRAFSDPEASLLIEIENGQSLQINHSQKVQELELPKDAFLVGADDSRDPDVLAVREYLKGRGLTRSDMLRWRICATRTGNFKRKAIIPSFDANGELNYFSARAIDDSPFKYTNAKRHRTEIIFNEIDIDWKSPVTLVEGIFDAINCPENTVPVLGSSLPKDSALFKKLWKNECKVTVAFDPDLREKSHKVCEMLSKAGLEVLQVWAPDGKDFGQMSKTEVQEVLNRAKNWYKEDKLFFKIRSISSGSLI